MKPAWSPTWALAFGVVGGLLGAGLLVLATRPPRGKPVDLLPLPTPVPLVIHVAGAIANPDVYYLPPGSRLLNAIEAAGGFLPDAARQSINLAAELEDGQMVFVPTLPATPRPGETQSPPGSQNPININLATQEELESLPGIGPVTAQAILTYRDQHGPFENIEAIQEVPGIGAATFEKISTWITIGQP